MDLNSFIKCFEQEIMEKVLKRGVIRSHKYITAPQVFDGTLLICTACVDHVLSAEGLNNNGNDMKTAASSLIIKRTKFCISRKAMKLHLTTHHRSKLQFRDNVKQSSKYCTNYESLYYDGTNSINAEAWRNEYIKCCEDMSSDQHHHRDHEHNSNKSFVNVQQLSPLLLTISQQDYACALDQPTNVENDIIAPLTPTCKRHGDKHFRKRRRIWTPESTNQNKSPFANSILDVTMKQTTAALSSFQKQQQPLGALVDKTSSVEGVYFCSDEGRGRLLFDCV